MSGAVHLTAERGVVRLVLDRPGARGALDEAMIDAMTARLAEAERVPDARVLLIESTGEAFCAGTDVAWMELAAKGRGADDLYRLGALLHALRSCALPVVARVHGAAIGAGAALVACADIAVAAEEAVFQLPAVRLGSVPAVIGPYVIEAIGLNQARRYMLTGEAFGGVEAKRLGLVHLCCLRGQIDETVAGVVENLRLGGPLAQRETKRLMVARGHEGPSPDLLREAARKSKEVRRTPEGREGLAAFVERRDPDWTR